MFINLKNINWSVFLHTKLKQYLLKDDIVVFHHIHKTAGTSLENILSKWYILQRDYDLSNVIPLDKLRNCNCKSGHYGYHDIHLTSLFPSVLDSRNYKVFTFIRDPLNRTISHYYHWKNAGFDGFKNIDLDTFLRGHSSEKYINDIASNWMARVLNVSKYNYREVLDNYFFIGLFEELQYSCDLLADKLNKKQYSLPNKRMGRYEKDKISQATMTVFKNRNKLDYDIYEYAKKRLVEER